jgi:CNP1-like family
MNHFKRSVAGQVLLLVSSLACAQNSLDNPDWVEEKEPPAPAFSVTKVLPLEMPNFVTVKVGIDPNTIYVGNDGIVRYVAVMTNSTGTSNAVYEGIRCLTGEVKTYARAGSSGTWSPVANPVWRDLLDNMGSQHPRMFARQAACYARVVVSRPDIIKALQTGTKPANQKNDNQV